MLLALAPPAASAEAPTDAPRFSGQVVPQLRHTQEVLDVVWARDGSFLATAGGDGSVRLWSPDGRLLRALRVSGLRSRIALSPDGTAVLVADVGSASGAEIWSTLGKRLRRLPPVTGISYVGSVAWSPSGDYVVICSRLAPRDACQLFDVEGRPLARLEVPPEAKGTTAVVVAPDGEVVYTAGSRSIVRWSRRGELLSRIDVPEHVGALAVSPDGTRLAAAPGWNPLALGLPRARGAAPATRILDADGRPRAQFPSHESGALSFSADGRWIVSGGEKDGRLLVNDAATGRPVAALKLGVGGQDSPAHVALSPDGTRFAFATHALAGGLRFVDLAGRRAGSSAAAGSGLAGVALDPSGRVIVTTAADHQVRLWGLDGRLLRRFDAGEEYSNVLEVDPRGRLIVTGSKVLKVWDPRGRLLAKAKLAGFGRALAFAPDGRTLWATDDRGWVVVFGLAPGVKTFRFRAVENAAATAIAVHPRGDLVAVGSPFHGVRLFDGKGAARGELELPGKKAGARVQGLAFTPDGRELVVASALEGHELAVFDLQGKLVRSARTGNRFVSGGLAVSPGGRFAAVTVNDDAGLYDLATLAPVARLRAHRGHVASLAFTRDERHLVTGSGDGSVRVWNVENGASIALLSRGDHWAVFTDDGLFDASSGGGELLALVDGMSAYGVDQVALRFNRPDLMYRRVGIGSEELWEHLRRQHEERLRRAGIRGAAGGLGAPQVRITAQRQDGDDLELGLAAEDAGHELATLQLWVNGVPALPGRGRPLSRRSAEVTVRVRLGAGRNHVEAGAANDAGFESRRASVIVERPAGKPGKLWFVGLGVSRHRDARLDLRFADRDVTSTAAALRRARGRFAEVRTLELVNERATRGALDEIRAFLSGAAVDDTVVLLAAGHGARDPSEEATFRFVTHDVDPEHLASTAIAGDELEGLLAGTAARRRLLLLDACQSGEVEPEALAAAREQAAATQLVLRASPATARRDRPRRPYLLARDRYVYRRLERRSGVVVFSSSLGDELSLESPALGNGLFTAALLRVLGERRADRDGDGWLSAEELEEGVKALVVKTTGGLQHPSVDQDNDLAGLRLPVLR